MATKAENEVKVSKEKEGEMNPAGTMWAMNPFGDLEHWFQDHLPNWFTAPFPKTWPTLGGVRPPFSGRWPKVDLIERDSEVMVKAELPGVTKENLEVSMTDHSVTIHATTSHEEKEEKGQYYRREISHGEFERTIPLPDGVNADAAKASFKNGVLELVVPKAKATPRKTVKVD
jgi:HSP20 family protein